MKKKMFVLNFFMKKKMICPELFQEKKKMICPELFYEKKNDLSWTFLLKIKT